MNFSEPGSKSSLARQLGVSRSGLYYTPKLAGKDEHLRLRIEEVMSAHPGYGYRRVAWTLGINPKRSKRVMNKFNLKPARRAKSPRKNGDKGNEASKYRDILSRFSPIEPDIVWVSDFTYICFEGRFYYLATVLDYYTGVPLGFNISRHHDASFVRIAVERAIKEAGRVPEYFHSDQGSEYLSEEIVIWLEGLGVKISKSPKGSPWRNGSQESFFGRFKVEFGDFGRFDSLSELIEEINRMMFYFTHIRIKNRLKMAPAEFRKLWFENSSDAPKSVLLPPSSYPHTHSTSCTGEYTVDMWITAGPPTESECIIPV